MSRLKNLDTPLGWFAILCCVWLFTTVAAFVSSPPWFEQTSVTFDQVSSTSW